VVGTGSRYRRVVVSDVDTRWLLMSVTTAGAAPSLRMQVWRKLKGLGALYLQQSVCLLPDRPAVATVLTELRERVRTDGGRMGVVHVEIANESERRKLDRLCPCRYPSAGPARPGLSPRGVTQEGNTSGQFCPACLRFLAWRASPRPRIGLVVEQRGFEFEKGGGWSPVMGASRIALLPRQHPQPGLRARGRPLR
jgi:hypothetical protein